jgi:hypothetical protein
MAGPFIWAFLYLFLEKDASERAERLLAVWPYVLLVSFLLALASVRRRSGMALVLPFVVIGTVHGAFLSQQLWGSTYALWPFLVLLVASCLAMYPTELGLGLSSPDHRITGSPDVPLTRSVGVLLTAIISVSLTIAGVCYVCSHERLNYANLSDGALVRSKLPALAGLATRGPWIPDFEELVRFSEHTIPAQDGLLMLPGEDLFYYATGRHPRFPVIMFDRTVNPYSPEEIVALARERGIRWLVVKRDLQLEEQPLKEEDRLLQLLRQDFEPFESLANYDIYKRR